MKPLFLSSSFFRKTKWMFPVLFLLVACSKEFLPKLPSNDTQLDGPIEGLTQEQTNQHHVGDIAFGRVFSEAEGLGPIFVSNSCENCHSGDGKGHPFTSLTRFGKMTATGFDAMLDEGGPQLQSHAIANYPAEILPTTATGITKFIAPAASGLGLVELVSDTDILAWEDANDANADGISGVASYVKAPDYFQVQKWHIEKDGKFLGRFGRKATAIDLLHQTVNAYINDMGISSDFHTSDLYNVQMGQGVGDNAPEPEVFGSEVQQVAFYLRTLKNPPRRNADDAEIKAGEQIFLQIGCEKCHRASFTTQKSPINALSEKEFHPYSDFLLHDMGTELDDKYTEGSATMAEWRTTPLWGLGLSSSSQGNQAYYLHDGRAKTLAEAIELHGGEGASSRENFRKLSGGDVDKLIQFLESL